VTAPAVPPAAPATGTRRPRALRVLVLLLALATGALALAGGAARVWVNRHLERARAEVALGHNAAARPHLEVCLRARPDDPDALALAARVARRGGGLDEAELILMRLEAVHGTTEPLVLERLLLRAARGEVEAVEPQLLARAVADGDDAELAREGLITGLIARFRWADAARGLRDWRARAPGSTTALLLAGKLEEQRQGTEQAVALYRELLAHDPDHDEARLRLAGLLVRNRHGAEALAAVDPLRARLPGHAEVTVLWAKALLLEGRTAEGRAALTECLRAHPDHAEALLERGALALADGDETEAVALMRRARDREPGNLIAQTQYAFALARTGRAAEAAEARARADALKADLERIADLVGGPLQARPNDPTVHHEIALIALRTGRPDEALRWFHSALSADPGHAPAHRALAQLYRELDKPVLAARHRALAQRPGEKPGP
jgi:tetratricopeptide (TPR) repeat protein